MRGEGDDWSAEPQSQPTDDERVLHGRQESGRTHGGVSDYAAAIVTQDAAWWVALSDYDYAYGLLRALENASARGAPLHLARCGHHVHDLLRGLDRADRTWVLSLLQRIQDLLARRASRAGSAVALGLPALLAYLAAIRTDPRFASPPALPVGLLQDMYPHGVSPADLREMLDRQRYPHGKPLPVCPVCELEQADPTDSLVQTVAALPAAERAVLVHLGQALALDGDAPDLREHVAWIRGARPVPAPYQATVARARQGDADWPLG